jgi:dienelactone hydrolase
VQTPYDENNIVYARYFPTKRRDARKQSEEKAVIIIPHLGGNLEDYDSLAKIIAKRSVSVLSVLMPYQGRRAPEGYISGELMVSANIKGTLDAFVQAVLDIHWATDWLNNLGYQKIGILGFSFGGIVASIATAHDSRLKAACLCLSGAEPAKVIFYGIATQKIKESFLHSRITEAELRKYWQPINPLQYMHKMTHAKVLMVNTMLDTVFPKETIIALKAGFDRNKVECQLRLFPFPCGHYGAGKYTVAKLYLLGSILCFLRMI